jgi:hypothetical protein
MCVYFEHSYCARSVSVSDGVDLSSFPVRSWETGMHPGITLRFTSVHGTVLDCNATDPCIILRGGSPLQEKGGPRKRPPPSRSEPRASHGVQNWITELRPYLEYGGLYVYVRVWESYRTINIYEYSHQTAADARYSLKEPCTDTHAQSQPPAGAT